MAAQLARHTHTSNRAKVRSVLERKYVFKSVLENPFQIAWPSIPANVQNAVLAGLVASLENVPPRIHTSRNISHETGRSNYRQNPVITEDVSQTDPPSEFDQACISGTSAHQVVGINAVTRVLESQLRLARQRVVVGSPSQISGQLPSTPTPPPIVVVFVCYADVDPTALIDHVPYLVAGCNSPGNATLQIKLVPLPKGSESTISQILGIRRAAVLAFRRGSPVFESVQGILDSVPIVSAPWLYSSGTWDSPRLVPTHMKYLRTTAPKEMKIAREQRSKARAVKKKNTSSSSRSMRRKPRLTMTTNAESTTA